LIIDEKSMVSRTFFARLSAYIVKGKALTGESDTNKPFRGVNVILSSNFHQFPPVAGSRNAPLFWPCDSSKDSTEELLGRKLYEEFSIVVHLKEQELLTQIGWTCCNTFVTVAVVRTISNCSDHSSLPTHHALLLISQHHLGMKQYL
jgi:hypothetical protein